MIFKFSESAQNYLKQKNAKDLIIEIDLNSKKACCSPGTVNFIIRINEKESLKHFKKATYQGLDIYYSPSMEYYFGENDQVKIDCLGLFGLKKIYISNEVNVFRDRSLDIGNSL